ncbi:MAG: DUF2924 domain-containing protein [Planctomycetota bacterium]
MPESPTTRANPSVQPTTPPTLQNLDHRSRKELASEWQASRVRGSPPKAKIALLRGLAWHLQRPEHGGLDATTRRSLKAAIRAAGQTRKSDRSQLLPKPRSASCLAAGNTLIRTWRGREHRVLVIDPAREFEYEGKTFASLSEIAREITGARWSGPRFFGLHKLRGA